MPNTNNPKGIWMQAAANAASGAFGIGVSRLGAKYDRKQQLKTQKAMMDQQMPYEIEMMNQQRMSDMKMWEDTGYEAQIEQMEKAGLNPGLLYGMGGGGGQTTGHGAPGMTAPNAGYVDTTGMGMQMGMAMARQAAEIENIKATTQKTRTETEAIPVNVDKTKAETKSITQGIENQKAAEQLIKIQQNIAQMQFNLAEQSMDDVLKKIHAESNTAIDNAKIVLNERDISDATKQEKIKIIQTELANKVLEGTLKNAQIFKTGMESAELKTKMNTMIQQLMINWDQLSIEQKRAEIQQSLSEFQQDPMSNAAKQISGFVQEAFDGIFKKR